MRAGWSGRPAHRRPRRTSCIRRCRAKPTPTTSPRHERHARRFAAGRGAPRAPRGAVRRAGPAAQRGFARDVDLPRDGDAVLRRAVHELRGPAGAAPGRVRRGQPAYRPPARLRRNRGAPDQQHHDRDRPARDQAGPARARDAVPVADSGARHRLPGDPRLRIPLRMGGTPRSRRPLPAVRSARAFRGAVLLPVVSPDRVALDPPDHRGVGRARIDIPRATRRLRTGSFHDARACCALLAPGRHHLDVHLPAAVPDRKGTRMKPRRASSSRARRLRRLIEGLVALQALLAIRRYRRSVRASAAARHPGDSHMRRSQTKPVVKPLKIFAWAWLGLLVLLAFTVGSAFVNLGTANTAINLLVSVIMMLLLMT